MRSIPALFTAAAFACSAPVPHPIRWLEQMKLRASFKRLSEDTFGVTFSGNGFTPPKKAQDFALLRAAELCRDNFKYFSVIATGDQSSSETIQTGGTVQTFGTVDSYGGFSSTGVYTHIYSRLQAGIAGCCEMLCTSSRWSFRTSAGSGGRVS